MEYLQAASQDQLPEIVETKELWLNDQRNIVSEDEATLLVEQGFDKDGRLVFEAEHDVTEEVDSQ